MPPLWPSRKKAAEYVGIETRVRSFHTDKSWERGARSSAICPSRSPGLRRSACSRQDPVRAFHLDATLVEPDTALPHCEGGLGTEQAGNRIGIEVISKEPQRRGGAIQLWHGFSPLNGAAYHEVERTARRGMRRLGKARPPGRGI